MIMMMFCLEIKNIFAWVSLEEYNNEPKVIIDASLFIFM